MYCWWKCRKVQLLWKEGWSSLKKLKMELLFDPVMPPLGIHPKSPKTPIRKNTCTSMFTPELFTIAKIWKQTKYPSVDEWIKKLWYIYTILLRGYKKEGILILLTA